MRMPIAAIAISGLLFPANARSLQDSPPPALSQIVETADLVVEAEVAAVRRIADRSEIDLIDVFSGSPERSLRSAPNHE